MKAARILIAVVGLAILGACSATDLTGPDDRVRADNTEVMGSPG